MCVEHADLRQDVGGVRVAAFLKARDRRQNKHTRETQQTEVLNFMKFQVLKMETMITWEMELPRQTPPETLWLKYCANS